MRYGVKQAFFTLTVSSYCQWRSGTVCRIKQERQDAISARPPKKRPNSLLFCYRFPNYSDGDHDANTPQLRISVVCKCCTLLHEWTSCCAQHAVLNIATVPEASFHAYTSKKPVRSGTHTLLQHFFDSPHIKTLQNCSFFFFFLPVAPHSLWHETSISKYLAGKCSFLNRQR